MMGYPQSRRGRPTELLAITMGLAKKVERYPCQRCGQNPEHGLCCHGVTRNLSVNP